MNTSARANASRRNTKKSTGPRTGAGKSRVATNAHRMASRCRSRRCPSSKQGRWCWLGASPAKTRAQTAPI
jgi:hypothetical protein